MAITRSELEQDTFPAEILEEKKASNKDEIV
jgi:hypothetical protein